MNYDQFRIVWHEALGEAGLLPFSLAIGGCGPSLDEPYIQHYASLRGVQRAGPFGINAGLSWKWSAALAARSATTKEDLLMELLGRDGYYLVTEQPWLWVESP